MRLGIRACHISGEQDDEAVKEGAVQGSYQVIYFTPELLLESKKWRKVLLSDTFSRKLRVFVVDEAHTVVKW